VRCFGYREKRHKKWKCPKIKERKREKAAPLWKVWKKMKEHCRTKELPPRGAIMSIER